MWTTIRITTLTAPSSRSTEANYRQPVSRPQFDSAKPFPTWEGNTGIAAHTTLANGLPGPFAKLESLRWGDKVIIHGWGFRYIYEVREVLYVQPDDLSVLEHDEYTWLTLITCTDYDPLGGEYKERAVVRAVLLEVKQDIPSTNS